MKASKFSSYNSDKIFRCPTATASLITSIAHPADVNEVALPFIKHQQNIIFMTIFFMIFNRFFCFYYY